MADGFELQTVYRGQHPLAAHCGNGGGHLAVRGQCIRVRAGRVAEPDGGERETRRNDVCGSHFSF
jgi:hypothetical protein